MVFGLVFLLFGFRSPELSMTTNLNLISNPTPENILSNITYAISDIELVGTKVQEASITKMEQTKGLFTKNLNMSVIDENGNLVALVITDVKNGDIGNQLNSGFFYGKEHQKAKQNYSIDLGAVVFSSSSYLILEDNKNSSTLSRNGWIDIYKCENGLLSGKFEFELENGKSKTKSSGVFENIAYTFME